MNATINPWLRVFVPFAVGYYLSYLLRNVNAVIAPDLMRDFGLGAGDLGLLTSAYLIAFGAFQLPLGLLLDRFGARRVEATLLLVTAAGAGLFAAAHNMLELVLGRALIGLGVSACLMASFKAFSQWFALERQASLNAAIMAAGSMGALTASAPLGWALPLIGWRGSFAVLAGFALLAAAGVLSTPEKGATAARESLTTQLRGLGQVLGSRIFWRFAPQSALIIGGFMAIQGLWAVPWLINFSGYTRAVAAEHLLFMSLGMLLGFLAIAAFVTRLAARGVHPGTLLSVGMGAGLVVGMLILLEAGSTYLLWSAMGVVFSVSNLSYALLARTFPMHLSGRANTALNLLAFAGAFSVQWGFGTLVDHLQSDGASLRLAYERAFMLLLVLQALSYAWYLLSPRLGRRLR